MLSAEEIRSNAVFRISQAIGFTDLVHRAFHAFEGKPLTVSKTGEVVSAVYGFALMLLKTINELKPTHCAIAFDRPTPTFRHKLFDEYKAHRPPTPSELVNQIGRVRQLVDVFHIPVYELDGYEADDVLGALSLQASQHDIDTIIVTGDADTMQLVSPRVRVLFVYFWASGSSKRMQASIEEGTSLRASSRIFSRMSFTSLSGATLLASCLWASNLSL